MVTSNFYTLSKFFGNSRCFNCISHALYYIWMKMQFAKVKWGLLGKNLVFFIRKLNYHAKTGTMTGTKRIKQVFTDEWFKKQKYGEYEHTIASYNLYTILLSREGSILFILISRWDCLYR